MADPNDKWPENAKGEFYVDEQCIDCDLCRDTAPGYFGRNEDCGYSFVLRQPRTEEDVNRCLAAMDHCPVGAIGRSVREVACR